MVLNLKCGKLKGLGKLKHTLNVPEVKRVWMQSAWEAHIP